MAAVALAWYFSQPLIAIGAGAVLLSFLLIRGVNFAPWNTWPGESWSLVMCDVGQGDALVLRDRGGGVIVFDVGGDAELIDGCLADLAVTQITAIVFTLYHRDHVGGISGALRGRNVQTIIATGYQEPKEQFEYVLREIPAGIP